MTTATINSSKQRLAHVAILVDDYDKAIAHYTKDLGFYLVEDTPLSETKRWVLVSPTSDPTGTRILLAKASGEAEMERIGNQTGGKVSFFLYTDNMEQYFRKLTAQQVKIVQEPIDRPWGKVAVFADLYGNLWDLIESEG